MITDNRIDNGKAFDWGRTSQDYARFRDIYPDEFYRKIHSLGLCTKGQNVLDLGTGTGVIPRNMYKYGACFTASDISENQIEYAGKLSEQEGMNIKYITASAEETIFDDKKFDVITACQCHFYFKHNIIARNAYEMLNENGRLAFLYMAWLPFEDNIAHESEKLILKYNPSWTGCNETRHSIFVPEDYNKYFTVSESMIFDVKVPFTRFSWNGRMKACRGVGASLPQEKIAEFEKEHIEMLEKTPQDTFDILHYCAITVLQRRPESL
ncbi:MAG: class I SAM-dependent methyltransferase [Oscillospiraceae bacterium]|nr:class I SAM-dependent methyltransferase [Oscillospiraceae bacterium]